MKQYISEKVRMLTKDFHFKLSFDEVEKLNTCTTEMQADRVARDIFNKRFNN